MRERTSPRAVLQGLRAQVPDTVETLKLLPRVFKSAVREAADGKYRLRVENDGVERLRLEIAAANAGRDRLLLAGLLWLSGFFWLAANLPHAWLGGAQLAASIVLFAAGFWTRRRLVRPR
jgi:hypothetical protein